MTTTYKSYLGAAAWIVLSPSLFLMAALSTVESLPLYYGQLVCFFVISILGMATGFGFIFQWSWAVTSAKVITRLVIMYFIISWALMAIFYVCKLLVDT